MFSSFILAFSAYKSQEEDEEEVRCSEQSLLPSLKLFLPLNNTRNTIELWTGLQIFLIIHTIFLKFKPSQWNFSSILAPSCRLCLLMNWYFFIISSFTIFTRLGCWMVIQLFFFLFPVRAGLSLTSPTFFLFFFSLILLEAQLKIKIKTKKGSALPNF